MNNHEIKKSSDDIIDRLQKSIMHANDASDLSQASGREGHENDLKEPSDVNTYHRAEDSKKLKIQSENMSKCQPGSKEEKADQTVEANPLAKDETSGGRLQYSKTHKFWETQPVGQFKDIGDTSLPEGPIQPASEVNAEPYNLPVQFEWTTCDMKSDDMCSEVYKFLKENYLDDEYSLNVNYSSEFLRWALCPPGYYQNWHVGVRVKTSKKLVAFISGVPARIRVRDEVVNMANINFLCIHKKLRSKISRSQSWN